MEKPVRERRFEMDFVRTIATLSIVLIHYNAVFLYLPEPKPEKAILFIQLFGLYLGNVGVSLFLILSGAALMLVYGEKIELKDYFIKRWKSIFPMFYIAYIVAFIYMVVVTKRTFTPQPYKFIFTIIGFDGYFISITDVFYLLGEWFLGLIILIYIVFPILRKAVLSFPKLTIIVTMIIYLCSVILYNYNGELEYPLPKDEILFVRIPEVLFGMYWIRYEKKLPSVYQKIIVIVSIIILYLNSLFVPNIDESIQTLYVGVCSFVVLITISKRIKNSSIKVICRWINKYSYAIFLTHHVVILGVTAHVDMNNIGILKNILVFIACCILTGIFSMGLYFINKRIKFVKISNQ